ncbi:MAG: pyridoxal-phosphate dependent enzyme, partial [Desulfobacterales bacterium]|nr:pyridoxal-phosphate dependent enzyme [Desulfobacterales bacterium]
KRTFLKLAGASAAAAGLGAICFKEEIDDALRGLFADNIDFLTKEEDLAPGRDLFSSETPEMDRIQPGELPVQAGGASERLALVRHFPRLDYSRKNRAKVRIINIHHEDYPRLAKEFGEPAPGLQGLVPLKKDADRYMIPWVSLFPKLTPIRALENGLGKHLSTGPVFIKDEGSDHLALFGNKARKYEFAFPSLMRGGAKKIITFGSLGSNHCVYTSLTAACADLNPPPGSTRPRVIVNLYPQRFHPSIIKKLKVLIALGARIRFFENDATVAMNILVNRLRERCSPNDNLAYYEPGGSNPLTTLAHVNALFELNEQIEGGAAPLKEPPDYIFIPLGSGGTAMGLVLGCFLLGWKTKVVGTTSQDKSTWKRTVVNGSPWEPFLVQNALRLLEKTISLLHFFEIPGLVRDRLEAGSVMADNFLYDNNAWKPAYGLPSERTKALMADARTRSGVT